MILIRRNDNTFTFELDTRDLNTITLHLMESQARCCVWHRAERRFIGTIEFSTMTFKPFDRAAAGVDPVDLGERTEAFISVDRAAAGVEHN